MNQFAVFIIHCIIYHSNRRQFFPDYCGHLLHAMINLWIRKHIIPRKFCFCDSHYVFKRSIIKFCKRHSGWNTTGRIVPKNHKVSQGYFPLRSKLNENLTVLQKIVTDSQRLTSTLITNQNPAACRVSRVHILLFGEHSLVRINIYFDNCMWSNKHIKGAFIFFQTNLKFFPIVICPDFRLIMTDFTQRCCKPLLFKSVSNFRRIRNSKTVIACKQR